MITDIFYWMGLAAFGFAIGWMIGEVYHRFKNRR